MGEIVARNLGTWELAGCDNSCAWDRVLDYDEDEETPEARP